MKRKLALLLAAVMTVSMLPMNVFGAADVRLSKNATVVPAKTVLFERGAGVNASVDNNDDVKYTVDGTDLILTIKDTVQAGDIFRLDLENAVWFFRNQDSRTSPTSIATLWSSNLQYMPTGRFDLGASTEKTANIYKGTQRATYDQSLGVWGFDSSTQSNGAKAVVGTYIRNAAYYDPEGRIEIPYMLSVSQANESSATIRILAEDAGHGLGHDIYSPYLTGGVSVPYVIRIPLVTRTTAEKDVKVKIDSALAVVSSGTYMFSAVSGTATNTYINDPKTARDSFELDKVVVKELRLNSIKTTVAGGMARDSFYLTAPSGFEFVNVANAQVGVEAGLAWGGSGNRTGYGTKGASNDYTIEFKDSNTSDPDYSTVRVTLMNLKPSTDISGSIYITGLRLTAEENAPWGDINLQIRNDSTYNSDDMVTDQTFKGGTRSDWTIGLSTEGTIPELVNGRLIGVLPQNAEDEHHKTARVVFVENASNAWWSGRQTVFTLPEGVKFRKVDITTADNLDESEKGNNKLKDRTPYINTGNQVADVKIDGNTMTWRDIKVKANDDGSLKKALIKFDVWVSIESGFKGDVVLSVSGSAVPAQGNTDKVPSVVIAKQITPVSVQSKITDIKIGYQYQKTSDIVITETKAGVLLKNKKVSVSITDYIRDDVWLSPDSKIAVTAGNLKIKDVSTAAKGFSSHGTSGGSLNATGGSIEFKIDTPSTQASTITISNVFTKVNRDVPESNDRPYKVVVWDSAIAENFGPNKDMFNTAGVSVDYARVISSANDKASVLNQEVKVTIGETYYTVNEKPYDMDASAYIQEDSNSTMIPVRFIANAFGISDSQVIWDDKNHTVTVIINNRTVQFTDGSSTMLINGAPVTMTSPDMLEVEAEIVGERMYIPFRPLGEAFGIKVDWDDSTQTAIYNPGAYIKNAYETNTTENAAGAPVATATPATAPSTK